MSNPRWSVPSLPTTPAGSTSSPHEALVPGAAGSTSDRDSTNTVVQARPYHRLPHLLRSTGRWWRPFPAVLLVAGLAVVVLGAAAIALAVASLVPGLPQPSAQLEEASNPVDIAILFGMLAVLLPAVLLGVRWGWSRRGAMAGTLHSVTGSFRWRLLARPAAVVLPVYALVNVLVTIVVSGDHLRMPASAGALILVYALVLVLVPLQCAAEEYLFRALPMQVIGTWQRSAVWGIVLPVPLFVLGHGYDLPGQVDIAVFALAMGFLVWKSGGIELPILVHTANNLTLMLVAPLVPGALAQGDVDPWQLAVSLPLTIGTTVGLTVWVSRREGVRLLEPVRGAGRVVPSRRAKRRRGGSVRQVKRSGVGEGTPPDTTEPR